VFSSFYETILSSYQQVMIFEIISPKFILLLIPGACAFDVSPALFVRGNGNFSLAPRRQMMSRLSPPACWMLFLPRASFFRTFMPLKERPRLASRTFRSLQATILPF
jgi:hypothetical protein